MGLVKILTPSCRGSVNRWNQEDFLSTWGNGENSLGIIVTGNIAIEYDMMNSFGENILTLADAPNGGKARFGNLLRLRGGR
ncbi:hypothetical protein PG993_003573 [Apiospora rasikravindrae]|uniref:Uncharacterized protein n=1 Tax=Apiospora rasikravindrae TaxID=990691 RepID=A0ABR1U2L9_9PEZI